MVMGRRTRVSRLSGSSSTRETSAPRMMRALEVREGGRAMHQRSLTTARFAEDHPGSRVPQARYFSAAATKASSETTPRRTGPSKAASPESRALPISA